MSDKITEFLKGGLREKAYPGAVLLVAQGEDIVFFHNVGNRAVKPKPLPMEKDTIFDLASLTKPLATTLAIMKLVDEGLLDLDKPISYPIDPFPWKEKADKPLCGPPRLETILSGTGRITNKRKKVCCKAPNHGRTLIS
jgi:CubicO group peptidase (beta-lactamase class C family)